MAKKLFTVWLSLTILLFSSISICAEEVFPKEFRIVIKDSRSGEVIYDNTTDQNAQAVEFTAENSRNITVKITAPQATGPSKKSKKGVMSSMAKE